MLKCYKLEHLIEYLNRTDIKPDELTTLQKCMFINSDKSHSKLKVFNTNIQKINNKTFIKLNYTQNGSPKNYLSIIEARGIIFEYDKNEKIKYKLVAYPFNRFYNHDNRYVDKINFEKSKVLEKLDGSLMMLWFCNANNNWIWSSRKSILPNNYLDKTCNDIFNKHKINFDDLNKTYTYIFEICSKNNKVVIEYEKPMLYHIGTRCIITNKELNININIQKPKDYTKLFKSLEEVKKYKLDSIEGFVVVDDDFKRIKVKQQTYIYKSTHKNIKKITNFERYINYRLNIKNDNITDEESKYKEYFYSYEIIVNDFINIYKIQLKELMKLSNKNLVMKTIKQNKYDMLLGNYVYKHLGKSIIIDDKVLIHILSNIKNNKLLNLFNDLMNKNEYDFKYNSIDLLS